ncbi:hypothetical protein CL619_05200 [archaeon]|nr:hypothetical protein [archaeon]|tara:strand:- start:1399 stop:2049 length:651 start_codon:yes stop_codon:yes gene_type:complete
MGKYSLYASALVALVLTACTDDFESGYNESDTGENLEELTEVTFTNLGEDFYVDLSDDLAKNFLGQEVEGWYEFNFSAELYLGQHPNGEDHIYIFEHVGRYNTDEPGEEHILAEVDKPAEWPLVPQEYKEDYGHLIGSLDLIKYGHITDQEEFPLGHSSCTNEEYIALMNHCEALEAPCYTIRSNDSLNNNVVSLVPESLRWTLVHNNCFEDSEDT